jgi:iron complex transport system substrate-binding protein
MKKVSYKIATLLIAAAMLFSIAGCSTDSGDAEVSPDASADATTRTITDMLGREVEIPSTVETAAMIGSNRIFVYAGCLDKMVGTADIELEANPSMPYAYVNADKLSKLTPIVSGGAGSVTYDEAIVTLHPDILFMSGDIDKINTMQEKTGIPVVGLSYTGIFDDSVYAALTLIGDIMGTSDHCSEVITAMKGWQEDLNNRTKDIPDADKPTVYAGAVSFGGGHGIEGTYANYPPFVAINAKNVVDETGETSSVEIDKEKLVTWDPDIIFLTPDNMDLVNTDYESNPSFYNNLSAVKNGQVYTQVGYNYWGCNTELAIIDAYYAGTVIYPEAFADVDFEEKADEIFTVMLGEPYMQVLKDNNNSFGKITIGE